ncbi:MAG: hypothetical protein QXP20_04805, partial [Candidatus Bathyarchaeia archaeon]
TLATGVLYWGIMRYDEYNQVVQSRYQRDWEAKSEVLEVDNTKFSVNRGNPGRLGIEEDAIENEGGVTIHLVRIWVINTSRNDHAYYDYSEYLNPGARNVRITITLSSNQRIYKNDNIVVRLVTERGNIASVSVRAD